MTNQKFLSKLKGISDPEEKRKIIGNQFIPFGHVASEIGKMDYLAQERYIPMSLKVVSVKVNLHM